MPRAEPLANFEMWKEAAKLQLEFIEKLSKYKYDVAVADLEQARANNVRTTIRTKQRVLNELDAAFRRLGRLRYNVGRRISLIQRMADRAKPVRRGHELRASQLSKMWQGYGFFEKHCPDATMDELMDRTLPASARSGPQFVLLRDRLRSCIDVPPNVENLLMYTTWVKSRRYMPRRGTAAHRSLLKAFQLVAAVADAKNDELRTALREMENSSYATWKPVTLLAIDTVDAKDIVEAGAEEE